MTKQFVHISAAFQVLLILQFSLAVPNSIWAQPEPYCSCEVMQWRVFVAVGTTLESGWLIFFNPNAQQPSSDETALTFEPQGITVRIDTPAMGERVRIWASCHDEDYFATRCPATDISSGVCIIKWLDAAVTTNNLEPIRMKNREVYGIRPNENGFIESRGRAGVKGAQFLYYREFRIPDPEMGQASLEYLGTSQLTHPDAQTQESPVVCYTPIQVSIVWTESNGPDTPIPQ